MQELMKPYLLIYSGKVPSDRGLTGQFLLR